MQHTFFLRNKSKPTCQIIIPSLGDFNAMARLPAGGDEDQKTRLQNISHRVLFSSINFSKLSVAIENDNTLSYHWKNLFRNINEANVQGSMSALENIPPKDPLLRALLWAHDPNYIIKLISQCIEAHSKGYLKLTNDVVITPRVFELLIKSVSSALSSTSKIDMSVGLPGHHAQTNQSNGFCILNTMAIILRKIELSHDQPIKFIILGTDVNRDDGLCQILRIKSSKTDIMHIDIFDPRVYPYQTLSNVDKEFKHKKITSTSGHGLWFNEGYKYLPLSLVNFPKSKEKIHPAIQYALTVLTEQVQAAIKSKQKIVFLFPMGWDSHQDESAFCGKNIDGVDMSTRDARKYRFNNDDMKYLYTELLKLYADNADHVLKFHIGLEGGYDTKMYKGQIDLLMDTFNTFFEAKEILTPSFL